jgi:hypothetical protein
MENKKCIRCDEIKLIDQFYEHPKKKGKYTIKCISCINIDNEIRASLGIDTFRTKSKKVTKKIFDYTEILLAKKEKDYLSGKWDKEYIEMFPEKQKAVGASSYLPKIKGKVKHHWNYHKSYWKDVIYLTASQHVKSHKHMLYDQKCKKYRKPDGTLLSTKEKHLAYISTIYN